MEAKILQLRTPNLESIATLCSDKMETRGYLARAWPSEVMEGMLRTPSWEPETELAMGWVSATQRKWRSVDTPTKV
jgi:hypothetical protein